VAAPRQRQAGGQAVLRDCARPGATCVP
jgi:hypothetical protein